MDNICILLQVRIPDNPNMLQETNEYADCYAGTCITVQAADRPEGPWSNSTVIYGSSNSPDGYAMYAPAVQPQYSDSEMSYLVLTFVGHGENFGNIIQAINMTFVKD